MLAELYGPAAWFLTFTAHATLLLALAWLLRGRVARLAPARRVVALRWALGGALLTATLQRTVELPDLLGPNVPQAAAGEVREASPALPAAGGLPLTAASSRLEAGRGAEVPATAREGLRRRGPAAREGAAPWPGAGPATAPLGATSGTVAAPPGGEPLAERAAPDPPIGSAARPAAGRRAAVPVPRALASLGALLLALGFFSAGLALARSVRLERALGERRPVDPDSPLGRRFARLQQAARATSPRALRAALTTAEHLPVPIAYGTLRPQVVLPRRALEECSADELDAALAHELAHIARGDLSWAAFDLLNRCLLCFHPLARHAAGRLEAAQESAADALGAAWTGRPRAMASMLARAAAWVLEARAMHAPKLQSAMAVRGHALTRRVEALLEPAPPQSGGLAVDRWLPALACALSFLPPLADERPGASAAPGAARSSAAFSEAAPSSSAPSSAAPSSSVPSSAASSRAATPSAGRPTDGFAPGPEPRRVFEPGFGAAAEPGPSPDEARRLPGPAAPASDLADAAPASDLADAAAAATALFAELSQELRSEAGLLQQELRAIARLGLLQNRPETRARALELGARAAEIERLLAGLAEGFETSGPGAPTRAREPAAR